MASPAPHPHAPTNLATLLSSILATIEHAIIPLTAQGVTTGSKVFGAAIISRSDFTPLTVATNNERISPLLHGEINCIQQFYASYPDGATRPDPRTDCIFVATHEPCSLCLSGITWSGFSEIYFLFTYEDSRDLFAIPHDIDILEQVFRVPSVAGETEEQLSARPLYNRTNKFFRARALGEVLGEVGDEKERERLRGEMERVKGLYGGLSKAYQEGKGEEWVSASVWK